MKEKGKQTHSHLVTMGILGQSQELEAQSVFPTWEAGTQVPSSPATSQGVHVQEAGIESQVGTPVWYVSIQPVS